MSGELLEICLLRGDKAECGTAARGLQPPGCGWLQQTLTSFVTLWSFQDVNLEIL